MAGGAARSSGGGKRLESSPQRGEEAIVNERLASVTSAGEGENQNEIIQSNPSPEFLNSLPFIKKFYPVLNLLHAPRVPQKQRGCSLLHLLAIRTRCTPSVRKFALPAGAREKFIKVTHETEAISRHSERQRKNPANVNLIKLQGENMNNLTETHYSPLTIHHSLKKLTVI